MRRAHFACGFSEVVLFCCGHGVLNALGAFTGPSESDAMGTAGLYPHGESGQEHAEPQSTLHRAGPLDGIEAEADPPVEFLQTSADGEVAAQYIGRAPVASAGAITDSRDLVEGKKYTIRYLSDGSAGASDNQWCGIVKYSDSDTYYNYILRCLDDSTKHMWTLAKYNVPYSSPQKVRWGFAATDPSDKMIKRNLCRRSSSLRNLQSCNLDWEQGWADSWIVAASSDSSDGATIRLMAYASDKTNSFIRNTNNADGNLIRSLGGVGDAARFEILEYVEVTSTTTMTSTSTMTTTETKTTTLTEMADVEANAAAATDDNAITTHFVEYSGQNCGKGDDATYQPGGNATLNRVYLYNAGDTEVEHLTKCAKKCSEYVVTGAEGCGGFMYEKEAVSDTNENLAGQEGACTLRQGPVSMDPACPTLAGVRFYRRMSAVVTVK
ncbi:unnamed protein product [Amoebophrya sp. A25]|nr:unnamed protein product [Amoebophrya sp. A25]|eukprot:GSA25T00014988001.1